MDLLTTVQIIIVLNLMKLQASVLMETSKLSKKLPNRILENGGRCNVCIFVVINVENRRFYVFQLVKDNFGGVFRDYCS